MKHLLVKSINQQIIVQADDAIIDSLLTLPFLKEYIPESQVQLIESDDNLLPHLVITLDTKTTFHFDGQDCQLSGDIPSRVSLKDVVTVVDYCLDYARQRNGEYCVHGSAVANQDNKGVYFLGPVSGLGKTTTALNLCLESNYSFVADEKLVIHESGTILGGIKHIRYNKNALQSSVGVDLSGKSDTELQNYFSLTTEPIQLNLVILPIVIQGSTLDCESWDAKKAEFHIYEEMTRKIRGISRRIENFSYPLLSIDTEEIAIRRVEAARKIAASVPFYVIRGEIKQVMDKIEDLL